MFFVNIFVFLWNIGCVFMFSCFAVSERVPVLKEDFQSPPSLSVSDRIVKVVLEVICYVADLFQAPSLTEWVVSALPEKNIEHIYKYDPEDLQLKKIIEKVYPQLKKIIEKASLLEQQNPLHQAVCCLDKEAVRCLIGENSNLNQSQGDTRYINIPNERGDTALALAIQLGNLDFIKFLVEECGAWIGISGHTSEGTLNKNHQSCIHIAIEHKQYHLLDYFIREREVNPNLGSSLNGETPLGLALRVGHKAAVQMLVDTYQVNICPGSFTHLSGAWLREQGGVLCIAALHGQNDMIEWLVSRYNNDVNYEIYGKTPLYSAIEGGHLDTATLLIDKLGVNIQSEILERGSYPAIAARLGKLDILKLLFRRLPPCNNKDPIIFSCLMEAVKSGHVDVVKHLINEYGLKIEELLDSYNQTLLHIAIQEEESRNTKNRDELIKYLVNNGGRRLIFFRNRFGNTPFIEALLLGSSSIVRTFISLYSFQELVSDEELPLALVVASRALLPNIVNMILKRDSGLNVNQAVHVRIHGVNKVLNPLQALVVGNDSRITADDNAFIIALSLIEKGAVFPVKTRQNELHFHRFLKNMKKAFKHISDGKVAFLIPYRDNNHGHKEPVTGSFVRHVHMDRNMYSEIFSFRPSLPKNLRLPFVGMERTLDEAIEYYKS